MKKTAKTKKAAALHYQPDKDQTPTLIGAGSGKIAERILEMAREHNIPIHKDSDLVEILSTLQPGDEIPPATYVVVAEILSFIYKINQNGAPQDSSNF